MVPLLFTIRKLIEPQIRYLTLHFHFLIKHFYKLLRLQIDPIFFFFFFFFLLLLFIIPPLPFTILVSLKLNLGVYAGESGDEEQSRRRRRGTTAVEFQMENGGVVERELTLCIMWGKRGWSWVKDSLDEPAQGAEIHRKSAAVGVQFPLA